MAAVAGLEVMLLALAVLYLMGALWFYWGTRRGKQHRFEQTPLVSVVVAARNEAARIGDCLQSLRTQDYPSDSYEIIVVDDHSSDGTAAIVEQWEDAAVAVQLVQSADRGSKKAALQTGVEVARGDIILTTDADCQVPSGWIRGLVAHFGPGVGMVIGVAQIGVPADISGVRSGYEAVDFTILMTCIWGSAGWGRPMAASGQNLAYHRAAYRAVGGYAKVMHRASGDDVLLMQLIRATRQWKIAFADAPETFVRHPLTPSWRGLVSKRSRWASNASLLARLDPLFFAFMVVAYCLNWLILAMPGLWALDWLDGIFALGAFAVKILAEWTVLSCGIRLTGRSESRRFFPLWVLLQPLYVTLSGTLGGLGLFRWKGNFHLWGKRVTSSTGIGFSGPKHR